MPADNVNRVAKRKLGNTSISLTEIGFGSAPIGNLYYEVCSSDARNAVNSAWSSGMRYFDTAPYYGFGLSERRIGSFLRSRPPGSFVLSSKVGRVLTPNKNHFGLKMRNGFYSDLPFDAHFDYSYDAFMRSFEDSLTRLGHSTIDVLLVHDLGEDTHGADHEKYFREFEKTGFRALEMLRKNQDVSAIGIGVNESKVCEHAMQVGQFDCFLLAGRYTLLEQDALTSFMPKCEAHGASVIIGGAYNSGILATGTRSSDKLRYNYKTPPNEIVERVRAIENICLEHKVPLAAAALQFPLQHDLVSSVVVGGHSARQIEQTLSWYHTKIPKQFWSDLKQERLLRTDAPTP